MTAKILGDRRWGRGWGAIDGLFLTTELFFSQQWTYFCRRRQFKFFNDYLRQQSVTIMSLSHSHNSHIICHIFLPQPSRRRWGRNFSQSFQKLALVSSFFGGKSNATTEETLESVGEWDSFPAYLWFFLRTDSRHEHFWSFSPCHHHPGRHISSTLSSC